MNFKTIALATAFALSSTFALAQAGGGMSGSGTAAPGSSGASVNSNGGSVGTSRSGTVGTNTRESGMNGAAAKPGGRDESKVGGQSTARKPAD